MKWKCLVVDDERLGRELIVDFIEKVPDLELVGACGTAMEANRYLIGHNVDLLFLDIQMPDMTGIEFLKTVHASTRVKTILTTAYSEYALESYELNVTDYLLKPIEFERFCKAVNKVMYHDSPPQESSPSPHGQDQLFLKSGTEIINVRFSDVVVINAKGAYVEVITKHNQKFLSLQSMSRFFERLPANFYRIHRSHIINIDCVKKVSGNTIFLDGHQVVISRYKKEEFLQYLGDRFLN